MTPGILLLVVTGLAILVFAVHYYLRPSPALLPLAPLRAQPLRATAAPAPAHIPQPPPRVVSTKPPELVLLEWEPDARDAPAAPGASAEPDTSTPHAAPEAESVVPDPLRQKLRDRYIAARFPGIARSSADLEDAERVIKGVRLYFEEQERDRADELLDLAIRQASRPKSLRLARLELAFLRRDASRFTEFARDFRHAHPDSPEWLEVARLGRALAPMETTLFGGDPGVRAHDSYGPWPDMPNWLQASWDLTAEVLRADFHREIALEPKSGVSRSPRDAA